MKNIFILCISLLSTTTFALDKVEHECVPIKPNSDFSKIRIVSSPAEPYGKEFLELYDPEGLLKHRWEVDSGDDMTYIDYFNEAEKILLIRDWPAENDEGSGVLEIGSWNDPNDELKTYQLECSCPAREEN